MPDTLSLSVGDQRNALRRDLRLRRKKLSRQQQKLAAFNLCRNLIKHPKLLRAKHIALYLANDGEIDPAAFIHRARQLGKICYLPVLHPVLSNQLWFVRVTNTTPLQANRFGIPEPQASRAHRRAAWALDCVLLPLVGFDAAGGRMGMGGGFYDRTFAFSRHSLRPTPHLIGLAHECQKVPTLPLAEWDIPLESVITDKSCYEHTGIRVTKNTSANNRIFGQTAQLKRSGSLRQQAWHLI